MATSTYILCLECSTDVCSVAILKDKAVAAVVESEKDYSHGELITQFIRDCMEEVGIQTTDLSAVSISSGPGSYTALRIAATVAKAICYSQKIPLIAVDSLEVLSHCVDTEIRQSSTIIPMIDARRMEVYTNIYVNGISQKAPHALVITSDSFSEHMNSDTICCGDGVRKTMDILPISDAQIASDKASASYMLRPTLLRFEKKMFEDIAYYSPFYLKSPNITKSKKKLF